MAFACSLLKASYLISASIMRFAKSVSLVAAGIRSGLPGAGAPETDVPAPGAIGEGAIGERAVAASATALSGVSSTAAGGEDGVVAERGDVWGRGPAKSRAETGMKLFGGALGRLESC